MELLEKRGKEAVSDGCPGDQAVRPANTLDDPAHVIVYRALSGPQAIEAPQAMMYITFVQPNSINVHAFVFEAQGYMIDTAVNEASPFWVAVHADNPQLPAFVIHGAHRGKSPRPSFRRKPEPGVL
ncbi:MAG: hypothetical protein WAW37_11335 [Syntrophobacteraceae bacterium]